ncbi:E1 ubiquitin-activating protein aos1, partial [Elasticomyces elasticus]
MDGTNQALFDLTTGMPLIDPTTQNGLPILTHGTNMMGNNMLDTTAMTAMQTQAGMLSVLPPQGISADEIALYDRQIRLWGMKAQEMIRNAQVLLIGMRALGNEIAKNLVLAGIGSLTILDSEPLTFEDLETSFLVTEEDIGQPRATASAIELRRMNPRVNIVTDTETILTKTPDYFSRFQIVICTNQPFEMASTINMSCRMYNVKFYAADTYGFYGYIFADLIMHTFTITRDKGNMDTKVGA